MWKYLFIFFIYWNYLNKNNNNNLKVNSQIIQCNANQTCLKRCEKQNNYTICIEIQLLNCSLNILYSVNNISLQTEKISIAKLKEIVQNKEGICTNIFYCQSCLLWKNLAFNETILSGCIEVNFHCNSNNYAKFLLGCLKDYTIIPNCFAGCLNDCNYQGICEHGICNCTSKWTGSDCSEFIKTCSPECIPTYGTCINGTCYCKSKFSGPNCSTYLEENNPSPQWIGFLIGFGIFMAIIAVLSIIAIIFYLYKKKLSNKNLEATHLALDDSIKE